MNLQPSQFPSKNKSQAKALHMTYTEVPLKYKRLLETVTEKNTRKNILSTQSVNLDQFYIFMIL
jgi:hypothetical protein